MKTSTSIRPLAGKYYGTVIRVVSDSGDEWNVELCGRGYPPSERELSSDGVSCSPEEWMKNSVLSNGERAQDFFDCCDGHYETQLTYELAKRIASSLDDF